MALKIAAGCFGDQQSWYEKTNDGNGTIFHGFGVNLLQEIVQDNNEELHFITDYGERVGSSNNSEYNLLISEVRAMHQGIVDMDMLEYVLKASRIPYIDYFMPYRRSDLKLISLKKTVVLGDIFLGIFDMASVVAGLVSLLVLVALLIAITKSGWNICIFMGLITDQGISVKVKDTSSNYILLSTALIFGVFITSMYKSIMISHLTKKSEIKNINSMEDFLSPSTKGNIYVRSATFLEETIKQIPSWSEIQDHVIMGSGSLSVEEAGSLIDGNLILFDLPMTLFLMHLTNYMSENQCSLKMDEFHISQASFGYFFLSPVMAKNHSLYDKFNMRYMKLAEGGLIDIIGKDQKANQLGITVPGHILDKGECKPTTKEVLDYNKPCVERLLWSPLTMKHFSQIFYIFGFGLILGVCAFFCEVLSNFQLKYFFKEK